MTTDRDFLETALAEIRAGITGVMAKANLHVRTTPVPRGMARRASGQLAALEVLLRRVIMLMALALLPAARAALSVAGFQPRAGAQARGFRAAYFRRLRLSPRPLNGAGASFERFALLAGKRGRGPVPAAKIARRILAMHRVISAPAAHATRLARHLVKLERAGEARPAVLPAARPKSATAQLHLVASILPAMLGKALAAWDNSS